MSHTNNLCLNCNESITKKFCPNCGQKTDTHRITLKHFIFHDLLHGVWHFEKGILFTLKEAIVRPGKAALDYISGKRIRYYNVFYLSLLMIGLSVLLLHFYHSFDDIKTHKVEKNRDPSINKFFSENVKFILFSIVPILAINALLIFRRLKLIFAEHLILAGICLLGMIQATILFLFINFINEHVTIYLFGVLEVISFFLIILFPLWAYFNAIKDKYTFFGSSWRLLVFYLLVIIQICIVLTIIIAYITKGKGDFYINL